MARFSGTGFADSDRNKVSFRPTDEQCHEYFGLSASPARSCTSSPLQGSLCVFTLNTQILTPAQLRSLVESERLNIQKDTFIQLLEYTIIERQIKRQDAQAEAIEQQAAPAPPRARPKAKAILRRRTPHSYMRYFGASLTDSVCHFGLSLRGGGCLGYRVVGTVDDDDESLDN